MSLGLSPPSQKYRTIGFVLTGGTGPKLNFTFNVRPEDLRRTEPSRVSVQQTLGGVLVDSFGAGISTITLSGHNGWRGGFLSSGESLFADLRAAVFVEWHKRRADQITAGKDPNEVELNYVDALDDITVVVAPTSFALMRSKSSPLLMRYSIELTVLSNSSAADDGDDSILGALSNPLRWLASVTGLGNVLSELKSAYAFVQSTYAAAQPYIGAFMTTATDVLNGLHGLLGAASPGGLLNGALSPFLASALALSRAGANIFHGLATAPDLTNQDAAQLIGIASSFVDAQCLLANGFAVGQVYQTLDDMLGASNCSSTGGGSDWSAFTLGGTNPFESLFAASPPDLTITFAAQQAIAAMQGDLQTLALNPAQIAAAAQAIATGVAVNT